jgi:metal-sulfur cluster biosynthetic enzyme
MTEAERLAALSERLARVTDPELDEPVTELGFVTGLAIDDDGRVRLGFRLPTYWCAANFAFMMADDIRRELLAFDWVTSVDLHLDAHMYGEKINEGLARGLSFRETFGLEASGDLDDLRRTFLLKSFQRRQEALLTALLDRGHEPRHLVSMPIEAVARFAQDVALAILVRRYLERRGLVGAVSPDALVFVDTDGAPLISDALREHVRALRRVGVNAEFNGAICRGLLAARYRDASNELPAEPTLLDFLHMKPNEDARPV